MTFITGAQLQLLEAPKKMRQQLCGLIEYLCTDGIANQYVFTLYGLHGTGKTTLMIQAIKQLLEDGINPESIGLFTGINGDSFDALYRQMEKHRNLRYILIDEINFFEGFLQKGSYLYDTLIRLYRCKVVISGSMPMLYTASKRTLYDRCRFIRIPHLSFHEYCKFILHTDTPYQSDSMRYMKYGGLFIEPDNVSDYVRAYITNPIIEMLYTQPKSEISAWQTADSEVMDWDECIHAVLKLACNYISEYSLSTEQNQEALAAQIPNRVIMDFNKYFSLSAHEREYKMKHTKTVALLDFLIHCGVIDMPHGSCNDVESHQCHVPVPLLRFYFTEEQLIT